MKINKTYKLEAACTKDSTRPGIMQPFIQNGRAIATDGKMFASVDITTEDGEEVEGKKIPVDALKAARKATLKLFTESHLTLTETHCTVLSGASFPVEHVDAVVPKVAEIVLCRLSKEDASFSVSLDISLLERLSQALGSEKVTLCFKDASSPITVYPNETPKDAFGLLMPIRTA